MKFIIQDKWQNPIFGSKDKGVRFNPKGYVPATVPNVVGMNLANATAALAAANLGINAVGSTQNLVASQSPAAATAVAPYSTVTCVFV